MATTATDAQDANLRYVSPENKVLFIQHEFNDVPKLGSEITIENDLYFVSKLRHVYDDAMNTLRHVRLEVEKAR